jgi:hypothetical protein
MVEAGQFEDNIRFKQHLFFVVHKRSASVILSYVGSGKEVCDDNRI